MLDAEKQAQVDAARAELEKLTEKSKNEVKAWWEKHLALGHRTLGKIFLGRKLKGEGEDS